VRLPCGGGGGALTCTPCSWSSRWRARVSRSPPKGDRSTACREEEAEGLTRGRGRGGGRGAARGGAERTAGVRRGGVLRQGGG
jgi:hypothetical protein